MATKIYGTSDDLIEVEGDIEEEFGCENNSAERPIYLSCSDGTELEVFYGKTGFPIWAINVRQRGKLFDRLEVCMDEDADIYSDIAYFVDGLGEVTKSRQAPTANP